MQIFIELFVLFSNCAIGTLTWTHYRFGKVEIEQILSTIFMGGEGVLNSDIHLIIEFLGILLLSAIIPLIFYKKIIKRQLSKYAYIFSLTVAVILMTKAEIQLWPTSSARIQHQLISEKTSTNNVVSETQPEKHEIKGHVPVRLVEISPPTNKRNLVLIYVESLETTYRNEKLFDKNLLADLDSIKGVEFTNYEQIFGVGWTIGAIVATQCGVPLRPSQDAIKFFKQDGVDGNILGETATSFMKGFICLGDILKNNGYTNVFLGGASGSFSGKDKFFRSHGYEQTYGREEWVSLGENSMNDWGLYDDHLFDQAKAKLTDLESKNKPFNLTILTVDTHHPSGFVDETCKKTFPNANFPNIVECTSKLVTEFINYIIVKYPNTDIVVLGDHLAMKNPVYDRLESIKHRTIFNKFIFQRRLEKNRDTLHHYSMLPTVLYGMGFRMNNGRLALGQTGLNTQSSPIILDDVEMIDEDNVTINALYKSAWSK